MLDNHRFERAVDPSQPASTQAIPPEILQFSFRVVMDNLRQTFRNGVIGDIAPGLVRNCRGLLQSSVSPVQELVPLLASVSR